ncbi:MAG: hypothetical protein HZB61_06130 [Nitrospirae bacterium]|nr:hypothetical protein [Nitrospirota bacterium]
MIFVLLLLINTSCAGTEILVEITPADIRGRIVNHTEISLFDGTALKTIPANDKFAEAHGVTSGQYGALFFTKHGYYPEAIIFRAQEKSVKVDKVSLSPLKDAGKGILTGVVYKPVTGGKLKEHKGIFQTFKGERITLIKDKWSPEITTDDEGIFMIELPPGDYDIVFNNENIGRVNIAKGRTTIKNIQKGLVLRD